MKKVIIQILISFLNIYSHAQTNVTDSMKQLLQKEKTDTGRILLLAELSFQLHESKPDTALLLALEAIALSKRIGFKKGEAASLNRIGNAFSVLGNDPKAMECFLQALKINEKINNIDGVARNLGNIGNIYREQGDYRKALEYTFRSKDLAEKDNESRFGILQITSGNAMKSLK